MKRVGVVGARGYVGQELLPMILRHPDLELAWVTSSSAVDEPVQGAPNLRTLAADPAILQDPARDVDLLFLALPNGVSAPWALAAKERVVVDLSTDHRFDPAWVYGQPDRFRDRIRGHQRIAAPGCYATAAQLAIAPLVDLVVSAHAFGVSGTSGAGTTKTERNDPENVRDNIIPYALVGHAHEREISFHLGRDVRFMPHVAPFFRGLCVTASMELAAPISEDELLASYTEVYGGEPFVELVQDAPRPRDSVGQHGVRVGGLTRSADGLHVVVVAALDNLLGGAASQAMRGANLALGLNEAAGLH